MHFDFAENNVKCVTRRAATFIQYRYLVGHNFAHSKHFPSKLGILSAYILDYIDKNYSTRKHLCAEIRSQSHYFLINPCIVACI